MCTATYVPSQEAMALQKVIPGIASKTQWLCGQKDNKSQEPMILDQNLMKGVSEALALRQQTAIMELKVTALE